MFDGVLNTHVFRLHLVIFCVIIANIWWGQKITLTTCLQKARRARDPSHLSLLILYNTHAPPWITTSAIQKNGNHHHFFIWIPILGIFSFGYQYYTVDKTHVLTVTVELIWLLFLNIFFSTFFQLGTNLLDSQDLEEAM